MITLEHRINGVSEWVKLYSLTHSRHWFYAQA